MSVKKSARATALAAVFVLLMTATAVAAPGDYDVHDTVASTAPASIAPFFATHSFNSSAFTTSPSEQDVNGNSDGVYTNKTGCSGLPAWWGGRSAWVRFNSPVAGKLRVDVTTDGYDPFIVIWNAPNVPLGTTQFATMLNQTCNAVRADTQESQTQIAVQANRPIHVETLGFCGRASYWTSAPGCTDGPPFNDLDAKSPGGATSVSLSFECDNIDGDGVCTTLDPCPAIAGAQNGCPDKDRDGTLDAADKCPLIFGTDAGCPADQDKDGIANAKDQCIAQPGYAPSGCPDADGDGVFYPHDACSSAKGIKPDGCPDSDGDNVSDRIDDCKTVFGESDDGCLQDLAAVIRWDFKPNSFRLKQLSVKTLKGAKIVVTCSAKVKSRCPFSKRTYTAGTAKRDIKSRFGGRSLQGRPLTLVFRVTKRGYLGTYKRYRFNGRTKPAVKPRCITPTGELTKLKCPSLQ